MLQRSCASVSARFYCVAQKHEKRNSKCVQMLEDASFCWTNTLCLNLQKYCSLLWGTSVFGEVLVSLEGKRLQVLIQEDCRSLCLCLCCWNYLGTHLWWGKCRGAGLRNRTDGVTWWLSNAYEQRIFLNGQEKNCWVGFFFVSGKELWVTSPDY